MECDHDRSSLQNRAEVLPQPPQLLRVNPCLQVAVVCDLERIKNDKVIALVVKRVISPSNALLEHLLTITWISDSNPALREDPEYIVVADGVMNLQAEVLFGLGVQIEQAIRSL